MIGQKSVAGGSQLGVKCVEQVVIGQIFGPLTFVLDSRLILIFNAQKVADDGELSVEVAFSNFKFDVVEF